MMDIFLSLIYLAFSVISSISIFCTIYHFYGKRSDQTKESKLNVCGYINLSAYNKWHRQREPNLETMIKPILNGEQKYF